MHRHIPFHLPGFSNIVSIGDCLVQDLVVLTDQTVQFVILVSHGFGRSTGCIGIAYLILGDVPVLVIGIAVITASYLHGRRQAVFHGTAAAVFVDRTADGCRGMPQLVCNTTQRIVLCCPVIILGCRGRRAGNEADIPYRGT